MLSPLPVPECTICLLLRALENVLDAITSITCWTALALLLPLVAAPLPWLGREKKAFETSLASPSSRVLQRTSSSRSSHLTPDQPQRSRIPIASLRLSNTSNSLLPTIPSPQSSTGCKDSTALKASPASAPKNRPTTTPVLPSSGTPALSAISSPCTSVSWIPSIQSHDGEWFTNERNEENEVEDEPFADALPFHPVNEQDEDDDEFHYPVPNDAVLERPVERVTPCAASVSTTPRGSPPPGCKLPKLPPLCQLDVVMSRIKGELATPKLSPVPVAPSPVPPVRLPARARTPSLAPHSPPGPPPSGVIDSYHDPHIPRYNPTAPPSLTAKDNIPTRDRYLKEASVTSASVTPGPDAELGSSLQPSPVMGTCYPFSWTAPTAPTSVQTFTPSPPAAPALPSCQVSSFFPRCVADVDF
ncbi:hypothetical protein JCM21900_006815 [Sporobolomyces salmonicolor]